MKSKDDVSVLRRLIRLVIYMLVVGVVLFVSYGGVDWVMGWVYMATTFVSTGIIIFKIGEDLLRERRGKKTGVKRWDIPLAVFIGRLGPLILLVVAGLDKRFGWSPGIPLYVIVAALLVFIFGRYIAFSAMMANKFFSSVVRIQEDRGHGVVSSGPYRYVRHPGYTAIILYSVSAAIVLESLWALIPAGLILIVTIIRTALEDRTLRAELEGYADYAGRVRYRLIPFVW
jgi:protein-S-isoprenylcysteine O-methyltransferase Ste14